MTQYLSLRQAVRPAVFAHSLMAGNREGAARLTAECDELLQLTRELLRATGHAALLGAENSKDFSHNGTGTSPHSNTDHGTATPSAARHDPTNPATPAGKLPSTVVENRSVEDFGHYSAQNPPQSHLEPIAPNHEMSDLSRGMPSSGALGGRTTGSWTLGDGRPRGGMPGDGTPRGGMPGDGTPRGEATGSGVPGEGAARGGTPTNGAARAGRLDYGAAGSGTPTNGTLDYGAAGRGTPGDGTPGSGATGEGTTGEGATGSGALGGGMRGDGAMGDRAVREGQLLDAYADAAMAWAKVTGALVAVGGTLLEGGDWDAVRRLADVLGDAGEANLARDLRIRLGATVFGSYRDRLQRIGNAMPPDEIARSIEVLRAVLRDVPEDFPDRDREVNRLLAPLAASVHKAMKARGVEAGFDSRVEHIATGGVAGYPEIVTTSLDELAAEFEGLYR